MEDNNLIIFESDGLTYGAQFVSEPGEYISSVHQETGKFYEEGLLRLVYELPIAPGLFIDVGANIGNHTVFFSKVLGRRTVAFEPHSKILDRLRRNVCLNGVESLVSIVAKGVLNQEGWLPMVFDSENWGKTHVDFRDKSTESFSLFTKLDNCLDSTEPVSFIKIDVEGAEESVIKGANKTISRNLPLIFCEAHGNETVRKLFSALEPYGYVLGPIAGLSDNLLFMHREKHAAQISLSYSKLIRAIERSIKVDGSMSGNNAIAAMKEIDRQKSFSMDLARRKLSESRRAQGLQGEVNQLKRKLSTVKEQLDYAAAAYSDLFYQAIPSKERTGKLYPRMLRNKISEIATSSKSFTSAVVDVGRDTILENKLSVLPYFKVQVNISKPVRVGIATIPGREEGLQKVIESLRPQADEIFISLNGFKEFPDIEFGPKVKATLNPTGSDQSKFMFLSDDFTGYYLTCDDDIEYPPYYVQSLVFYIEKYKGEATVGWHGSYLINGGLDYYDSTYRRVKTFGSRQLNETYVSFLGTGCMGFDAEKIRPPMSIFTTSRMADIHFALFGQNEEIPFVLVPHERGEAVDLGKLSELNKSISGDSIAEAPSEMNTRDAVNAIVKSREWFINTPNGILRALLIGRISEARWHKGGIFKSCELMAYQLRRIGYHVDMIEIESSYKEIQEYLNAEYDIGFVYTGDQIAQDYYNVRNIVHSKKPASFPVYFNLSFDLRSERTNEIIDTANKMPQHYGIFVFTEQARDSLKPFLSREVIVIPKTVKPPLNADVGNQQRKGVFLGDVSKFLREELTPQAEEYFFKVAAEYPLKDIHFVSQYATNKDLPGYLKGVTIHKHSDNIHQIVKSMEVYVHLNKYCTFEMLPVETLFVGTPVLYISMPQSLNTYIGNAGRRFETPIELSAALSEVLSDKSYWNDLSQRGKKRAAEVSYENTTNMLASSIDGVIKKGYV